MFIATLKITKHTDIETAAKHVSQLTRLRHVSPTLKEFRPDLMDDFAPGDAAETMLGNMAQWPGVTSYLLLMVQGNVARNARRHDNIVYKDPSIIRHEVGVMHANFGPRNHDRVIGMATLVGNQGLNGLIKLFDPMTWSQPNNWTEVSMWCDPRVLNAGRQAIARYLAYIAPDESFVLASQPTMIGSRTLHDPSAPLVKTQKFLRAPQLAPKNLRSVTGKRRTVPRSTTTYISKKSRAYQAEE